MKKQDKIDKVKSLQIKRDNSELTIKEEKLYCKLNSELTGFPEKVFTKKFNDNFFDIITKTDTFIKKINKPMSNTKKTAIEFVTWIDNNGWIRDPFPRKEYSDNKLRYSNIAMIDIHSDDKLKLHTIEELFDMFKTNKG